MKKIAIALTVIAVIAVAAGVRRFSVYFPSVADEYAEQDVRAALSELLNLSLLRALTEQSGILDGIITAERGADGRISYITVDTERLNIIRSVLTLEVYRALKEYDSSVLGIPVGNALGIRLLSGKGPKIPVTIIPLGSVTGEIKSSFSSAGINQTKYELNIEFSISVNVLTPFTRATQELKSVLCVAQTVIIGETPGIIWGQDG